MKCFSTLEHKFRVSAFPCNILFYSSSKLKIKLEVISRYLEVIPVSFREITETSRKDELARPILSQKLVHNFIAIFHIPNHLGWQWRNRLIPQVRVFSDLAGHTGEWVETPGKQKKELFLPRIS